MKTEKERPPCRLEQAVGSHAPSLALEPADLPPQRLVHQDSSKAESVWLTWVCGWERCPKQCPGCDAQDAKRYQGWTLAVHHPDLPLTNPTTPPSLRTLDLPGTCSVPSQCGTQGLECPSLSHPSAHSLVSQSQILVLFLLNKAFKINCTIVVSFSAIVLSLWWAMACLLTTCSALTLS